MHFVHESVARAANGSIQVEREREYTLYTELVRERVFTFKLTLYIIGKLPVNSLESPHSIIPRVAIIDHTSTNYKVHRAPESPSISCDFPIRASQNGFCVYFYL